MLDYDPTCISYFTNGDFLVIGGSNRKVPSSCPVLRKQKKNKVPGSVELNSSFATCFLCPPASPHPPPFCLPPRRGPVVLNVEFQASLYTKEGVRLHTICDQAGWVWSCAVR